MPLLNEVFDQSVFDSAPESIRDFSDEKIINILEFLKEFALHPNLNYADIFNSVIESERFGNSVNEYRRSANCFNSAYTAQNSMFCNTLANVLPTIQSSSTSRYL